MENGSKDGLADAFVASILAAGADKGFRSLDVFVTWFVAGTAAAIGLAAANFEKLDWVVTPAHLKAELPYIGTILVLVLISKFLGSLICTMAGAMDATLSVMRRYDEIDVPVVDVDAFEAALRRSRPWPLRVAAWSWKRIASERKPNLGRVVTWLLMASSSCAIAAATLTIKLWVSLLG
ncbi:hypothetical protein ACN9MD_05830 [Stenotrophomonas maltophilia]|uniref:hypothetical protein n=1 Tax=Stenotrophomonas maltophilia TaxID=40324 RepID=UPI0025CBD179|nr:hypothetical protein [uncultured Stenotrophomonas sp.]